MNNTLEIKLLSENATMLERHHDTDAGYDIKGRRIDNGNPFEIVNGKMYQINKGDKLAQLVIVPIWTPELQKVDEFSDETARGQNGFGSTGI